MKSRILFVDDDTNILAAFQRSFRNRFALSTASSGECGLALLDTEGPFAVIVADMQMPRMNGIQFLKKAHEKSADSVRLMLTGNADQKTAAEAINQGHVFSFLTKPCPPESLEMALENALKQYRLVVAEKELLEQTLNGSVKLLTETLGMIDAEAFGSAERLREEVRTVASWLRTTRVWELELGAMLLSIGAVSIPPLVLQKMRSGLSLNRAEREIVRRIPEAGAALVSNIPRLQAVAEIIRYQHKDFDGSGFPADAVKGEEIPIGARVLRVLADLLILEKERKTRFQAIQQMQLTTGKYDPKVLEAVAACFDIYLEARHAPPADAESVLLAELAIGDILAGDVRTKDGTLLVSHGIVISPLYLQKLRNYSELNGIHEPISIQRRTKAAKPS